MTAGSTNINTLETASRLYYYGARYYDPKSSVSFGVDLKADKYPGWSVYSYTLGNSIRLICLNPNVMEPGDPGEPNKASTKSFPVQQNSELGSGTLIPGVEVIDKGQPPKLAERVAFLHVASQVL